MNIREKVLSDDAYTDRVLTELAGSSCQARMRMQAKESDQFFQSVARPVELNTGWEHWASRRHILMALKGDMAGSNRGLPECQVNARIHPRGTRGNVDGDAFLRQSGWPHIRHRSDGTARVELPWGFLF